MKIGKAILKKRITEDCSVEVNDNVPVGMIYNVDLESRRMQSGYNFVKDIKWTAEIITVVDGKGETLGWYPTELLEITEVDNPLIILATS